MFKERFTRLCNQKGVSPTAACAAIGLSNATYSCWTDKSIPRKATLMKIADYFGVSMSYLIGVVDDPDPIALIDPSKKDPPMPTRLEEIMKDMTEEELAELERYAEYLLSKKKG